MNDSYGPAVLSAHIQFVKLNNKSVGKGIQCIEEIMSNIWALSCERGSGMKVERGSVSMNSDNPLTEKKIGINWWFLVMQLEALGMEELVVPHWMVTYVLGRRLGCIKREPEYVKHMHSRLLRRWYTTLTTGLYITVDDLLGVKLLPPCANGGLVLDPVRWNRQELVMHRDMVIMYYIYHEPQDQDATILARIMQLAEWLDSRRSLEACKESREESPVPTHYKCVEDVERIMDLLVRANLVLAIRNEDVDSIPNDCRELYEHSNTTVEKLWNNARLIETLMESLKLEGEHHCVLDTGANVKLKYARDRYRIRFEPQHDIDVD